MPIRQTRLPDPAGTPRPVVAEPAAAPTTTPTLADAPPPAPPVQREAEPEGTSWTRHIAHEAPADPRPWYRSEAWLAVELASVVPVLAALVAPEAMRPWLVGLAGALIALGLAMLVVRDREARRAR